MMNDELNDVDSRYVAAMLVEEAQTVPNPLGIADLARFLTTPRIVLSADQTRRLFTNVSLRQAYTRLRKSLTLHEVPALAAASDGAVEERSFEGGSLLLVGDDSGGWYLRVRISEAKRPVNPLLLIEKDDRPIANIPLGQPDASGGYLAVLDMENAVTMAAMAALRDPSSEAFILSGV